MWPPALSHLIALQKLTVRMDTHKIDFQCLEQLEPFCLGFFPSCFSVRNELKGTAGSTHEHVHEEAIRTAQPFWPV